MKWFKRSGLLFLALLLVLLAVLAWLLTSSSGARVSLSFANRAVPGLELSNISGSLRRGLEIGQLRYRQPGRELVLERVLLVGRFSDWQTERGVLSITVANATLRDRPRPSSPIELTWPEMPALPLEIDPLSITVQSFRWFDEKGVLKLEGALGLEGRIKQSGVAFERLTFRGPDTELVGSLAIATGRIQPTGKLNVKATRGGHKFDLDWAGSQQADAYRFETTARAPIAGKLALLFAAGKLNGELSVPKQLLDKQSISARLQISGTEQAPELRGRLRVGSNQLRDLALALALNRDGIEISQLEARLVNQIETLSATGSLAFKPDNRLQLRGTFKPDKRHLARFDAISAPVEAAFELSASLSELNVSADVPALNIDGSARLKGDTLTFNLRQNDRLSALGTLKAGALDAAIEFTRFDPATWVRDWPGELSGKAALKLPQIEAMTGAQLRIEDLGGTLRGRELIANGELNFGEQDEPTGQLSLLLGANQANYSGPSAAAPAQLALDFPDLSAFAEGLVGHLGGEIRKRGQILDGNLTLKGLTYADTTIEEITLTAAVDLNREAPSTVTLNAIGVRAAGQSIAQAKLTVVGTERQQRFELNANTPTAVLSLIASGGREGKTDSRYTIEALTLTPTNHPAWRSATPAVLSIDKKRVSLSQLCLQSGTAQGCLVGEINERRDASAELSLSGVDVAAVSALALASTGFALAGEISGQARLVTKGGQIQSIDAALDLPKLTVSLTTEDRHLELEGLSVRATGGPAQLALAIRSKADAASAISGDVRLFDLLAQAPLRRIEGDISFTSREALSWLLSSDEIRGVRGEVSSQLSLSGSLDAPLAAGTLEVKSFGLRIPAYGTVLSKTNLRAEITSLAQIRLNGSGKLGDGEVTIDGLLSTRPLALNLNVKGDNLRLVSTSSIKLSGAPDLNISLEDGLWRVDGQVDIPTGNIALDQFDEAVRASEDQEFTDVDPATVKAALPLMGDVDLKLGPNVTLSGAGLTGTLSGAVTLKVRPGAEPMGSGQIVVNGRYLAFGRKLDIETAKLNFGNSLLSDPALDIRASRMVGRVKAGVRVRGTAAAPDVRIYTDPASTQADALSYLVVGRPLSQSKAGDQAKLSGASKSLGSGLLAQEIGLRFGLDDVALEDGSGFDGPRLMLGKYLSPRLYVAYGISQFDSSTLFRLRYLINAKLDVEVERGEEIRAILNYRVDR